MRVLAVFCFLLVLKRGTLEDPFYWDAMGYVSSTALDMVDHGYRLIHPYNTGHPPLFFLMVAVTHALSGGSLVAAHGLVLLLAALGLVFTYRIGERLYGQAAGVAAATLTLFNQVFFAQIGTLNPTTAIFAFGAAAVHAYLAGRRRAYVAWGCALLLLHQAAVLFAIAIAAHALLVGVVSLARPGAIGKDVLVAAAPLVAPAAWGAYAAAQLGWVFNQGLLHNRAAFPETLGVNLLRHFVHDSTGDAVGRFNFVATGAVLAALVRFRRIPSAHGAQRPGLLFLLLCAAHVVAFSYSDDLPRYFQPMLPYLHLAAAGSLSGLLSGVRRRDLLVLSSAGGLSLLFATNYRGTRSAPGWRIESNMEYADSLFTHREAAKYLEAEHPDAVVVTCWPMNGELSEPRHGYVSRPLTVTTELRDPPAGALLYYSPESACRGARAMRRLAEGGSLLRRFERSGKRAFVYQL